MSAPVDVGTEVAALHFYLATAQRLDHDAVAMLEGITQHRDAFVGSATDDAWLWTMNRERNEQIGALAAGLTMPCPDCRAAAGQPCHVDCSSRWDDGGQP